MLLVMGPAEEVGMKELQLHDVQRVAHRVALLVMPKGHRLLVTNGGGSEKHLRETLVDTLEEAMELAMAERNGRESLLRGKY